MFCVIIIIIIIIIILLFPANAARHMNRDSSVGIATS